MSKLYVLCVGVLVCILHTGLILRFHSVAVILESVLFRGIYDATPMRINRDNFSSVILQSSNVIGITMRRTNGLFFCL